jgi:hypothetical protein
VLPQVEAERPLCPGVEIGLPHHANEAVARAVANSELGLQVVRDTAILYYADAREVLLTAVAR